MYSSYCIHFYSPNEGNCCIFFLISCLLCWWIMKNVKTHPSSTTQDLHRYKNLLSPHTTFEELYRMGKCVVRRRPFLGILIYFKWKLHIWMTFLNLCVQPSLFSRSSRSVKIIWTPTHCPSEYVLTLRAFLFIKFTLN